MYLSIKQRRRIASAVPVMALAALALSPSLAHASTAGGGSLPWDTPFQTLMRNITGPTAYVIALLGLAAGGAALMFGGEMSEFIRRILYAVGVAAFLTGAAAVLTGLGIIGALV